MALDLIDTTPFPTLSLGELDTARPGFTFAPEKSNLDLDLSSLELNLDPNALAPAFVASSVMSGLNNNQPSTPTSNITNFGNSMLLGGLLEKDKAKADKLLFGGAALKTAASAGRLFNSLLTYGIQSKNLERQRKNTKMSVENKMQALDNQVLYYKNQITDKFNTLMARNTLTMAAKNLRVSTGALLEQTKDAAYDATKDIEMLESNAELKKIALRNEEKQSKIAAKLGKSQLVANVLQGMVDLGLNVATAGGTMKSWGDLYANAFPSDSGSLNEVVYGGK